MADSTYTRGRVYFECYTCDIEESLLKFAAACMGDELRGFCEPRDVLQAAYAEAFEKSECFQGGGPSEFARWLRAFVRNEASNLKRFVRYMKQDTRRLDPQFQGNIERIEDLPDPRPGPAELLLSREKTDLVNEAIQRLTWRQMSLLQRVHLEGLSTKEAGSMLGLEPSSASKCLERGRLRIRELLERSFGESAR